MTKFIIYATETCQWCKAAKDLLVDKIIPYEYIVLRTPKDIAEFQREFPGAKTVPQIITNTGLKIGGYDALREHISELYG